MPSTGAAQRPWASLQHVLRGLSNNQLLQQHFVMGLEGCQAPLWAMLRATSGAGSYSPACHTENVEVRQIPSYLLHFEGNPWYIHGVTESCQPHWDVMPSTNICWQLKNKPFSMLRGRERHLAKSHFRRQLQGHHCNTSSQVKADTWKQVVWQGWEEGTWRSGLITACSGKEAGGLSIMMQMKASSYIVKRTRPKNPTLNTDLC